MRRKAASLASRRTGADEEQGFLRIPVGPRLGPRHTSCVAGGAAAGALGVTSVGRPIAEAVAIRPAPFSRALA